MTTAARPAEKADVMTAAVIAAEALAETADSAETGTSAITDREDRDNDADA